MGMDIHLNIVKDGICIAKEIFDGRNSEWFRNMTEGDDGVYRKLPIKWGISEQAPSVWDQEKKQAEGYFDFRYISVKEFKEWFNRCKPHIAAGWVTRYDKWMLETKGVEPEEEPCRYLPEDARPGEYYFIEYENPYDCSNWLYNYLVDHKIPDEADLCYWFDW